MNLINAFATLKIWCCSDATEAYSGLVKYLSRCIINSTRKVFRILV